jgi:predicted nuclease of predicted toxin-antitoxin system
LSLRFHLDEHISTHIAAGLRRRNIDVTTATEAGLTGARDEEQLKFAASSGRVLLTQDADFLRLHAQGFPHSGIAYYRQQSLSPGDALRRVILLHDLLSAEELAGRVEFL